MELLKTMIYCTIHKMSTVVDMSFNALYVMSSKVTLSLLVRVKIE